MSTSTPGLGRGVYTCIPDATVSSLWEQALSARGYFDVRWDVNGTCTYLRLANGSLNTNF